MLRKWLNNWLAGDTSEKLVVGADEGNLSGLNLKEVLAAHDAWKVKLKTELMGKSATPIDVTVVASDCKCVLGKWLHSTGKKQYSKLPEFKTALDAHAKFHIAAAEVVIEHQSGNTEQANLLLNQKFRNASNSNQLELVRLFTAAER